MIKTVNKSAREIYKIISGKRRFLQSFNLLKYRLSKKELKLRYKPIYLTILPIHRCNLSCKMCLTHSKELGEHAYRHTPFVDMPLEMFKDILRRFPESLAVGFMGNGEPLLHEDIFAMTEYAEKEGRMYTSMITNGIILDRFTDRIISSSLSEICISINGHDKKEFSRMTGMDENLFEKIIESSRMLIGRRNDTKSKLKIDASIIVDSTNFNYLQQMVDYSAGLGFDEVSFYNILPLTIERAKKISIWDDGKSLEALNRITLPKTGTRINLPVPLDGKRHNNICNDFFSCINIDGEGNVGGCNRQRFNIKNAGKYYDPDVFNNPYFVNERRKFLDGKSELDEPCRVCFANSCYAAANQKSDTDKK